MAKNIVTRLEKKALGMSFLTLAAIPVILASSCTVRRAVGFSPVAALNRQAALEVDRADLGLLTWPEQLDAVRYELEVLDGIPLNLDSAREAAGALYRNSRIYSAQALLPMEKLRKKQTTGVLYYRVRAFDLDGRPLGNYSQAVAVQSSLQKVERNAPVPRSRMQDTNGSLLLYPVYAYTGNPGATQSESGDTSAMMVERFDRDVRPFHLKYLLIMGGTNSLRAGVSAEEVIRDLEEIGQKAEALGIHPIYLTLPPLNPANIQKAFDEPTADNWRQSFAQVNAYIRSRDHIDVAAPFGTGEDLPTELSLDGIHGDWNMKQIMAQVINRSMAGRLG